MLQQCSCKNLAHAAGLGFRAGKKLTTKSMEFNPPRPTLARSRKYHGIGIAHNFANTLEMLVAIAMLVLWYTEYTPFHVVSSASGGFGPPHPPSGGRNGDL